MSKRDKFVKKVKKQLDEWNSDLNKIEKKVEKTTGDVKATYQKQSQELRTKLQEGEQKLEKIVHIAPPGINGNAEALRQIRDREIIQQDVISVRQRLIGNNQEFPQSFSP